MSLYIVSTPIGNLQDITLRAIEILKSSDLILCEDTRVTGGLLYHLGIKKEMQVINDSNEETKIYEMLKYLQNGKNIVLVSDAGTPLISDPGFKLIREAIKKNIKIVPIPGPSSITTALCAAGVPTDKFLYLGFLPDSYEKKKNTLLRLNDSLTSLSSNKLSPTVIFFESPHRLLKTLDALQEVFGDIEIVVARELTKIYEEFLRDKLSLLKLHFEKSLPKGEFVILINSKTN